MKKTGVDKTVLVFFVNGKFIGNTTLFKNDCVLREERE